MLPKFIAILAISSSLFCLNAYGSPITGKKMRKYQDAIELALGQTQMTCQGSFGVTDITVTRIETYINNANSVEISKNGAQPLFTFSYGVSGCHIYDCNFSVSVKVTTTEDQSIVSLDADETDYVTKEVNLGHPELTNPDLQAQTLAVPGGSVHCQ